MAKCSSVITPTPCTAQLYMASVHYAPPGCIISIRLTYSCAEALINLFTYLYLHSWLGEYKTGNISETVEDRAKVTINGLHKQESAAYATVRARQGYRLANTFEVAAIQCLTWVAT